MASYKTRLGNERLMVEKIKKIEAVEPESVESDEIIVKDPLVLRPVELPLVITLPSNASKAQIAFAKVLNAYAYKNPTKWAYKKDDKMVNGTKVKGLITQLKELKDAPDPIEAQNLKFGNKLIS